MKQIKLLSIIAAAAMIFAACDKTSVPSYSSAETPTGEQVFFPNTFSSNVNMAQGETSFTVPVWRANSDLEAVEVVILSSGEGLQYFSVPASVSFAEGKDKTELEITLEDADALGLNNFPSILLQINDSTYTTPYGLPEIELNAGISLAWNKFDDGTLYLDAAYGGEYSNTVYYQQVSDTWRRCAIFDFWDEGVNYEWYWNTETNYCVVAPICTESGIYISDACGFYYLYQDSITEAADAAGGPGTIGYCEYAVAFELRNNLEPCYYDGAGTFYIADWCYIVDTDTGRATGRGYAFGGTHDRFNGGSFTNYSISASYDGMFIDTEMNAFPVISFEGNKKTVSTIYYAITSQDVDASETEAAIVAGTVDTLLFTTTLVDGASTEMPALDPGSYRLVAIPYDDATEDKYQTAYTYVLDFYFPGANAEVPEVNATLELMGFEDLYGSDYGYYNYNSVAWWLEGSEIKSAMYYLNYTSALEGYGEEDLIYIVQNYGSELSETKLAALNEKGFTYGNFINMPSETSLTMLMYLTNNYESTALLSATYTTTAEPSTDGLSRQKASSRSINMSESVDINVKVEGFVVKKGYGEGYQLEHKLSISKPIIDWAY